MTTAIRPPRGLTPQADSIDLLKPVSLDSLAGVAVRVVPLAESQVLESASELGLLVAQARDGARRAAGEKSGRKSYRKNNRFNFHNILLCWIIMLI
ncbi:MAG: hypothetical protein ACREQV_25605 [Candidatus Binatia bacterium]